MAISLSAQQPKRSPTPQPAKTSFLFQVKALYDFTPTDHGELQLRKGDVVDVLDHTTFPDWWKGSFNGNLGIFPSNYVERIGSGVVERVKEPMDEIAVILNQAKTVHILKESIAKADPLGHNYAENERLQTEYQNVVELVPSILKYANQTRQEQGIFS